MKKIVWLVAVTALLLGVAPAGEVVAGPAAPAFRGRPHTECPENSGRTITFSCIPGAAAGVAGIYGGTGFGLVCNGTNGMTSRVATTICTTPGDTSWAISGAASLRRGAQVRFGTSGSDAVVHYMVGNGEVRLNILP
jgi:hypothetical protein